MCRNKFREGSKAYNKLCAKADSHDAAQHYEHGHIRGEAGCNGSNTKDEQIHLIGKFSAEMIACKACK